LIPLNLFISPVLCSGKSTVSVAIVSNTQIFWTKYKNEFETTTQYKSRISQRFTRFEKEGILSLHCMLMTEQRFHLCSKPIEKVLKRNGYSIINKWTVEWFLKFNPNLHRLWKVRVQTEPKTTYDTLESIESTFILSAIYSQEFREQTSRSSVTYHILSITSIWSDSKLF